MDTNDSELNTMDSKIETIDKKKKEVKVTNCLKKYYLEDPSIYEIGVDEVGRGPGTSHESPR